MRNLYARLARTNMKNNKTMYFPFVLSGIISVSMFYLMIYLSNNQGLQMIPGYVNLRAILGLGAIVIAILSYIFLFYTNSFIIKRRKKEIGVYNILGMEKRHIAKILGIESLTVAAVSIAGGLLISILFSKLMTMLLYSILDTKMSIRFEVCVSGILWSLIVFGLLYFILLIYNLLQIKLANPIDLLRGSNVGEKEPKTKLLMTIAGVACIGAGYYISITRDNPLEVLSLFFVAVILVIVGTYFLFIAGSIVVLKALRKNKKFYYQKRHYTAVSGMLYRMKQNAAGLASICVLSTMVLVMVSTTVSMFVGVDDELKARYPMEVNVQISEQSTISNVDTLVQKLTDAAKKEDREITDVISYSFFRAPVYDEDNKLDVLDEAQYSGDCSIVNVMTRENFMKVTAIEEQKDVPEVPQGSILVYASQDIEGSQLTYCGITYPVAYHQKYVNDGDRYMISMLKNDYYIVVNDNDFQAIFEATANAANERLIMYESYIGIDMEGTKEARVACADAVREELKATQDSFISYYLESRQENEQEFFTLYGGLFFIGMFLGIMFLIDTVIIIFYKQITEGFDDQERYLIMEKVGMSNKEVKDSIQSQVRMVFFLPIITAAIHVAAAFPMVRRLLLILNLTNTVLFVECLAATLVVFLMIYYIVFKLTSKAYYKIVGQQVG